jgi:hypothetical protein
MPKRKIATSRHLIPFWATDRLKIRTVRYNRQWYLEHENRQGGELETASPHFTRTLAPYLEVVQPPVLL